MIDTTLYALIILIAFIIYKNNSKNIELKKKHALHQKSEKTKKYKPTLKKMKSVTKTEIKLKDNLTTETHSLPETTVQNNSLPNSNLEPIIEKKSNLEKYNFNTIYEFSRYDFEFMNHFESLGSRDYQKKLNSIQSAIESGVINQKIIFRMIYAELTQISRLSTDSPKDPDIMQFMNELVITWRAQDPTYINSDLVQSLAETAKSENEYLVEMKNLLN